MTGKAKHGVAGTIRKVLPYVLVSAAAVALAAIGSEDKNTEQSSALDMEAIASSGYAVTIDQLSEFYSVAEIADSMSLPSSDYALLSYNSMTLAREANISVDVTKVDKQNTTTIVTHGVEIKQVTATDTVASIAAKYPGVTEQDIRYSNGMKKDAQFEAGATIYIPTQHGIIHHVTSGETIESLAEHFGSTVDEIIHANDLEKTRQVTEGMYILIPRGTLPEKETPDYVAPVAAPAYNSYRIVWTGNNPGAYGQCTYYAWARRYAMGGNMVLPGGLGNANTWDDALYGRYRIDYSPEPGAVFQTDAGWYGHVGIVESVNGDGSVTMTDMNGVYGWGRVSPKWTISAAEASRYKYIHEQL